MPREDPKIDIFSSFQAAWAIDGDGGPGPRELNTNRASGFIYPSSLGIIQGGEGAKMRTTDPIDNGLEDNWDDGDVFDREFDRHFYDDDDHGEGDGDDIEFALPGGESALRAATETNPRNLPCPTCGEPDRLTAKDRALGYQCDDCANQQEMGW
jgi:hypothetical protein